jgi:hypothetical protein
VVNNTLKPPPFIKTEPSRLLTKSLSSNQAASISQNHTQVPNVQEPTIVSKSVTDFPKLESTEPSVPMLLERMTQAQTPRGPRSTPATDLKRHRTYTSQPDSPGRTNSTILKRPRTSLRQRTPSEPTNKLETVQKINRMTRELWDTRREISAAKARESTLKESIRNLDPRGGGVAESAGDIIESEAARSVFTFSLILLRP